MNTDKILEMLFYFVPAGVTAALAYGFFQSFFANEEKKRMFLIRRRSVKETLQLRLQAYERMTLFLERIDPVKLLIRVTPQSSDKVDYANFVIAHIDHEFEHNLSQQIYVSDRCWSIVVTAKNAIIQNIRKTSLQENVGSADGLRESILNEQLDKESATVSALSFIKEEVRELL